MIKIILQRLPLSANQDNPIPLKIFATGHPKRLRELKEKIGAPHTVHNMEWTNEQRLLPEDLVMYDLIFDLNFDDDPSGLSTYAALNGKTVIVGAVKKSLHQLRRNSNAEINCHLIGMNTLPTFINRSKAEVSFSTKSDETIFEEIAKLLNWEYLTVEDQVGMVTPRVIAMIINEACFTLHEETASMHDIDAAMKLGTNYPFGPFEWCDRIGVKEVYEMLLALANDTSDERYKICPLLKEKYLMQEQFY